MGEVDVAAMLALVAEGVVCGVRIGSGRGCRIEVASIEAYLDDQAENARPSALWEPSPGAGFPEP